MCFDHPDNASSYRKPGAGMFLKAKNDHNLRLSTLFNGGRFIKGYGSRI